MYMLFFLFSAPRRKLVKAFRFPIQRNLNEGPSMRILNVAEKHDAAKNISALLSKGTAIKREGLSKYNKIYEFDCQIFGRYSKMIMTSVLGHLLDYDFAAPYSHWKKTNPSSLFDAPIRKFVRHNLDPVKRTLEIEAKKCSKLIIWTDCDREGENIGFEIIEVCKGVKQDLEVYRAVFSEITTQSVLKAIRHLEEPKILYSSAVEVRRELDLRIGAAFTRFQTLYLQKAFPNALSQNIVSYGSCQFPTLGFVVDRFKAISDFKPEKFWDINVEHTVNELTVSFKWERKRLFERLACEVLFDRCAADGSAKVENIETKPKSKWRPRPLTTVEFQKLASSKLKINAKKALEIAESLYTQGLISYPRTETNSFSKHIDLVQLVSQQVEDQDWGVFAQGVLADGPNPFQGNKSDDAHPPIHPIKYTNSLTDKEKKVYELVVRHFLACLSKNAEGFETVVHIDLAGEKFLAKGLMITARNYLDVYPYENWVDKQIHFYNVGDVFRPKISMQEGETCPPDLLTEPDLIALMEKHGIGTDATHAEHIETIKARQYVGIQDGKYFVPCTLGMGLVEGYRNMGYGMAKPKMRADLEEDLKRICEGQKSPEEVLKTHLLSYKQVYEGVEGKAVQLFEAIQSYIQEEALPPDQYLVPDGSPEVVGKCPSCDSDLLIRNRKKWGNKYIGCSSFPHCRVSIWLPSFVLDVQATENTCPKCGPNTFLLKFKFKKGACSYPPNHIGCVGGCDMAFLELLTSNGSWSKEITAAKRTDFAPLRENNDSGFVSLNETSPPETEPPPNCFCEIPAASFTVKKSGVNQGRQFYGCGRKSNSSGCDFFMWKSAPISRSKATDQSRTDSENLLCYCSLSCRRVRTNTGPNKGREFFCCGKNYQDSSKCGFFKWVDNVL